MTTLTKDTVISISGGDYVPGTPGSPARQAWTEIIRVPGVPARAAFIPIDASAIFPEYHWVMLPAIPDTYTVINHPAVAAVAPTPPTGGPLTFVAHNNLGWNSGAVNMTAISSNGTVSLTGPAATGTVIGLASADPQGDYRQIAHGLYFTERKVFVVEHGVRKTGGQDAPGNAMLITRTDGVVSYSVGGVVIFTSAEASPGTVLVAAVFYAAHDYVKDVVVTTTEPLAARGGSGYGILPRLSGLGSNYAYSGAASRLPALVSTASDAGEQPSYAIAEAILAPVRGSAHGLTGGVGTGAATLPTLEGFGSDRPMGTGRGTLPALRSYGAEQPTTGWSHITAPMATVTASASPTHAIYTANLTAPMATLYAQSHDSTGENAADITAPMATLSAFMGSGAKIKAPVPTVSATATGTNWLKADVTAPMATLEAAGTVSGTSQANIRGIMASAVGYGGMVAAVTITGHPTVQATVTNGGVCSANLAGPMAELTLFEVTREDTCSADIIAPMGKMGGSLAAWITAPMATLVAIGSATVAATYEAYAVNLNHKPRRGVDPVDETTRYTNFPFTHVVRYKNSYYGVNTTGMYLLEGTTDDAEPTPWAVKTAVTDFDSQTHKTVAAAYFGGRLGAAATVTLHAGEGDQTQAYSYTTPRGPLAQNHRQVFGKGIKAHRYYALAASGSGEMAIDDIELDIHNMTRRI